MERRVKETEMTEERRDREPGKTIRGEREGEVEVRVT